MFRRQVWAVVALVTVSAWSAVMAVLGQTTALAALVPSLILVVEQVGSALAGGEPRRTQPGSSSAGSASVGDDGDEGRTG